MGSVIVKRSGVAEKTNHQNALAFLPSCNFSNLTLSERSLTKRQQGNREEKQNNLGD